MNRRNILTWCLSGGMIGVCGCSGLLPDREEDTSTQFDPFPFTEIEGTGSPDAVLTIEGDNADSFGTAVAAIDQTILVGAPKASSSNGSHSGAVYAFQNTDEGWDQTAKLIAPQGGLDEGYGGRIAEGEETLFIRDTSNATVPIAVLDQTETGWQQTATIASSTHTGPLALADSTAVLGVTESHSIGIVYERQSGGWEQQETISVDEKTGDDRSIRAVATDGETAVFGDIPKGGRVETGNAYIYEHSEDGWEHQSTISSDAEDDQFGAPVAIHDGTILIGDPANGTVYCFSKQNGEWKHDQRYSVTSDGTTTSFGSSLDFGSQGAVIGDPGYGSNGAFYHIAEPTNGDERTGTYYTGPDSSERFGRNIAITNNTVVVVDQDTAYIYSVTRARQK